MIIKKAPKPSLYQIAKKIVKLITVGQKKKFLIIDMLLAYQYLRFFVGGQGLVFPGHNFYGINFIERCTLKLNLRSTEMGTINGEIILKNRESNFVDVPDIVENFKEWGGLFLQKKS